MMKYDATAVNTMELQLPIFRAFMTELSSPLMRTKKVPAIENKIPNPPMTMGNKMVGAISASDTSSRPKTMVANMVAT